MDNYVKILFRFYSSVLDQITVETLWAEIVDAAKGLYKIDNIPFYAAIATGDIVLAELDEAEQMLTYRETVEASGNSTIQVVIMDQSVATNEIREIFTALGCDSEQMHEGYFVLEIKVTHDYQPVKSKLSDLHEVGIIDYAEIVLSDQHQYRS